VVPGKIRSEQCEGCTLYTTQIGDLAYLHEHDVTYATLCQGPYEESVRYRDFMGWTMPWYSAPEASLRTLLVGRRVGMFHLVCYLREGERVFETYWTNGRGVEAIGNTYTMLDLTPYGRQETWTTPPPAGRNAGDPTPPKSMILVDVRSITVGHVHAEHGDPSKVAERTGWLLTNPDADLPALDVRAKPNGTYRIHDGCSLPRLRAGRATGRASRRRLSWMLRPAGWREPANCCTAPCCPV
jgi:hypothetical protein